MEDSVIESLQVGPLHRRSQCLEEGEESRHLVLSRLLRNLHESVALVEEVDPEDGLERSLEPGHDEQDELPGRTGRRGRRLCAIDAVEALQGCRSRRATGGDIVQTSVPLDSDPLQILRRLRTEGRWSLEENYAVSLRRNGVGGRETFRNGGLFCS